VALAACSSTSSANRLFIKHQGPSVTRASFVVCHGFSCNYTERVALTDNEWDQVLENFKTQAQSPEEERHNISKAVAQMEQILGPKSGTENDRRRSPNFGTKGQQDCIDESVNTMTYITFLDQENLIKYHTMGEAKTRGHIIDGWPSNTATLIENESGIIYTVDSFFHKNGELPEVVTLDLWMTGWRPEKFPYEVER
jgi:hypothetical protein